MKFRWAATIGVAVGLLITAVLAARMTSGVAGTYEIPYLGGIDYGPMRGVKVASLDKASIRHTEEWLSQVAPPPGPRGEVPIIVNQARRRHFRARLAPGQYILRGGSMISTDVDGTTYWGCATARNSFTVRAHRWAQIHVVCNAL